MYFAVEAVFIGDDFVGFALVEAELRFAFGSFFGGGQLFLGFVGFRLGFAFEIVIAEEFVEGELFVFREGEFGGGESALLLGFALILLGFIFLLSSISNRLLLKSINHGKSLASRNHSKKFSNIFLCLFHTAL